MDDEEFGWLVQRLENESANAPRAFRTKVLLVSCAAHALLALVLLTILATLGFAVARWMAHGMTVSGFFVGLTGAALLPVAWILLREFLTPLPTPAGRPVTRSEAPVLFKMLDKMRAKLKRPRIN